MDQWALVTGASGGIGLEIARELAAAGYALVLSARSDDKLQTLAEALRVQHGTRCLCMPLDLGAPDGPETLQRRLAEAGVEPTVLVNNAGFGVYGRFAEADVAQTQGMIDLNISALTRLTALLLPAMLRQGRGRILNVARPRLSNPARAWRCISRARPMCCRSVRRWTPSCVGAASASPRCAQGRRKPALARERWASSVQHCFTGAWRRHVTWRVTVCWRWSVVSAWQSMACSTVCWRPACASPRARW